MIKTFTLRTFFLSLLFTITLAPSLHAQISVSDNPEQCVIDFGDEVTFSFMVVPLGANDVVTSGSLEMSFDLYHSWKSDVTIELCAPGGTPCALIKNGSGSSFDLGNGDGSGYGSPATYTITDAGTGNLDVSSDSPPGTYAPVNPFSVFDNIRAQGTWTLTLSDGASGDDGCMQNVTLTMDAEPVSPNPLCASLDFPTDGSTVTYSCGGTVELSWTPASSGTPADSYDVYFGTTPGNLTLETNTTSTTFTKTSLSESTTYFWQIIPKNGANASNGCTEWSFNTGSTSSDSGSGDQTYTYANSTAPGGPTYNWVDPVANGHTEITSWTSGTDDDGYFTVADMGITFNYNGGSGYTECHIGTNGYVSFGQGYTTTGGGTALGTTSDPDNMIAVCMMDLDDRTDGQIFYTTSGTDFIITWLHYHDYNDDSEWISMQLVLDGDADGGFIINYNQDESSVTIPDILTDAVIGAEFGDSEFVSYRSNGSGGPVFCSPLAVQFSQSTPLPVELTSFEGEVMNNYNMLTWETATEANTEMHVVERSLNGRSNWESIGNVPAAGNSNSAQRYRLEDANPVARAYYRLKSVDFDGSTSYSDVVSLVRRIESFEVVSIVPNPATEFVKVIFQTLDADVYTIQITNMVGQVVSTQAMNLSSGVHNQEINVSTLTNGIYFVTVGNGAEFSVHKIIKQ